MNANPQSLYSYSASAVDLFGIGTKTSQNIIDSGMGSGVIVLLSPSGPAPYAATLTVLDSNSPSGPFTPVIDPQSAVGAVSASTPNKYLISSTQRYVTVQMVVLAGAWQASWSSIPAQVVSQNGLVPYKWFTTGPITSSKSAFTLPLGSLLGGGVNKIVDSRQITMYVFNVGTGQPISGATLTAQATSPGGLTRSIIYPESFLASGATVANNASGQLFFPLALGVLDSLSLVIGTSAPTSQGQIDVLVIVQGAGSVPGPAATNGGGATVYVGPTRRDLNAAGGNIQTTATTLYALNVVNNQAAIAFIQVFNKRIANVTLGTTNPDWEFQVAANTSIAIPLPTVGLNFPVALSMFSTTTEGGAVGSAAGVQVFVAYI